ncbi:PPP4R2-domain-containing protein [Panaeolus papilionaceus]|nr:PPP4R2-domain-containing protein [Panaeolus papilionaceus]
MTTSSQEWLPEYEALLQKIASDDVVDSDWDKLRDIIKIKIAKNISLFLTTTQKPPIPSPYLAVNTDDGGLKLPPFPPRKFGQHPGRDSPLTYMTEDEANTLKDAIFVQLDSFEGPPFTIQRLCELCIDPKKHYKSVGKYLRAVDKSIYVTSTIDSFPPLTQTELQSAGRSAIMLGSTLQSAPSTPLFSPIPFLHDDARRSKSRSPPPTPLTLNPTPDAEMKAIGMVDELDDPSPGHMSEHPTALTSVTTLPEPSQSRPFLGSLEQRFVKAEDAMDTSPNEESDRMELDDDKENTGT